jgi:hypothetical protein
MYTRIPTRPLDYKNRNEAKPKEILIDYNNGHIYVADEDGNIFDASTISTYIIKIKAIDWEIDEVSNIFYQDIKVDGILASDYPIADILVSDDMTRYNKELDAWSSIIKISTFDNYIRVFATKSIDIDIDIVIKNDKTYIRPNDDDLKEATNEQNSTDSE